MTKACTKCGETKPLTEFHIRRKSADGLGFTCKDCVRVRSRDWAEANRERKRTRDRAYREANAERIAARQAEYREAAKAARRVNDPRVCTRCGERIPEARRSGARYCSDLCQKRSEINRATWRRRARLRGQFVEDVDPGVLYDRDGGVCGICGGPVDPYDFHVDHIVPIARGGEHSYANTQLAHPRCNRLKSDKLPEAVAT